MAVGLFGVPLRGSLWLLFATSSLFLLAALGMGLLISTVTKNQFVAGQLAIITTYLPAFILSGFIFDIGSMPRVVQAITHIVRRPLFRGDFADAVSGRQCLVGNPAQRAGAGADGGLLLGMSRRKLRKRLE